MSKDQDANSDGFGNQIYAYTNSLFMKILFVVLSLFCSVNLSAQIATNNWFVKFDDAVKYAHETNVDILMVFAGSDWCRPCIQFKKDILESGSFRSYAENGLALLYLDFPSKKKNKLNKELSSQNEMLAEKYNQSGSFPKIILFDNGMEKLKEIPFTNQSANSFIDLLKT